MSNFQNQEINIGSVVLGDRSLSNDQYGDKKSIHHVNFDHAFSGVPKVSLGITFLDTTNSSNQTRVRAIAQNITKTGMDVSFTTWDRNSIYDMAIDYVAVFNPKVTDSAANNNYKQTSLNINDNNDNEQYQDKQYNQQSNDQNDHYQQHQYNEQQNQRQQQQQGQQQGGLNGKTMNIKSNKFNNYLRDNNGKGDMSPTARSNEMWNLISATGGSDLYYIHNKFNHYLSSNGERVLVGVEKNDSCVWKISQHGRQDVYSIQNFKTGNYLSATDRSEAKTNVKVVNSWEEFSLNFIQ